MSVCVSHQQHSKTVKEVLPDDFLSEAALGREW
jgi:hypothetical protein